MSLVQASEEQLIATDIHAYLARNQKKEILRFLTCGSVDDGKSTLIGRLLFDSKTVYEDQLAALKSDSARRSSASGEIDYSLLVDGLQAEREQGITIDVAYRYFSTPKRKFIIADTPGHEQYTRNMVTGASTANLAIILIDARQGVLPQTRRHSFIASLLGIKHIVVAINKMDLVDYSEEVFERIKAEYTEFSARLEAVDVRFIPMSALKGDNVVVGSANMPWYQGGPLLDYLETVHIAGDRNMIDMRFPVQYVLRPNQDFRGLSGTVASGVIRKGDEVMVLPSGRRSRVERIVTQDGDLEEAFPPQAVTILLADDVDVSRGDMLVHVRNVPHRERTFEAMVVWMSPEPMRFGRSYIIKHTTNLLYGEPTEGLYRYDINTLKRIPSPEVLELNEIGRVAFSVARPLFFDAYSRNKGTGSFVIVDRTTNITVGAGMILDRQPNELVVGKGSKDRAAGLTKHASVVGGEERAKKLGHEAAVVWLTGLPRAGKTTISQALERRLFDLGVLPYVLDGENMRLGLSRDLGFTADDRSENSRRAAEVAKLVSDAGLVVLAALTSPYASDRESAKTVVGKQRFVEVHLSAPVNVCEGRDPELYAKAKSGAIKNFTGVTAPYEEPTSPDLVLPTHELSVDVCVDRIVELLRAKNLIR
ncbi:sulfate adenylyltransferase subunit CysN [Myxococcota bacterium]|nr:sulfate adenylyltransferase subunit CysN [Myxococcota bacterium]